MAQNTEIDVIIPVYRPDERLHRLLRMLTRQTVRPARILLVNTEEALFDDACLEGTQGVEVLHIKKSEFDHGGTRHMAAMRLQGAFLLFLTQDAVPADVHLVENLYRAFGRRDAGGESIPEGAGSSEVCAACTTGEGSSPEGSAASTPEEDSSPEVCAAYARQLPDQGCGVLERFTRSFNYGSRSMIKTAADLPVLGIKTFFCSNVCAMYRRSAYEALGGFERRTIFNEDMIFAGKLIAAGKAVAYCADARVIHSHNYSGLQQLRRNFDLGVSQADHPEIFGMARSESEGIRMVRQMASYLCKTHRGYLLPKLVWQSGCKYLGYRLGKNYRRLPGSVIARCTMNPGYWKNKEDAGK